MLFDLRVVLAACLATVFFLAVGLGLLTGLRSPLKASAGYALNDGPAMDGPGLPQARHLPAPEPSKPEITGSIVSEPAPPPPAEAAPVPARVAPAGKRQSITTLIEKDRAEREKAAKAAKAAKKPAAAKRRSHRAAKHNQPARPANPFSLFTPAKTTATR